MSELRTILVSNRLPVTASVVHGELVVERSVGGLATALADVADAERTRWVGWPGPARSMGLRQTAELDRRLAALGCVAVRLSQREVSEYYESAANAILWPLLHYQTEQFPLTVEHWDTYTTVNTRFAERAAEIWQPGDLIWVHDYHLFLVPQLLRRRLPDARIGFFLHTPFPAADVFRILPWRRQVLEGVLGADVIGFHTQAYADHFQASVRAILAAPAGAGQVQHEGRSVLVKPYPIGIDAARYERLAEQPSVREEARQLAGDAEVRIIAGVDRLDYTKGIPRRLLAFEQMLARHAELHGKVRLIQVVVPSRERVRSYREFKTRLEATIGRINGTYGTPSWTPVSYAYRSLEESGLSGLYLAADVMLVTPLRDGMNLVAKEFVASHADLNGVLVLSEFTGAADELSEAVLVNPYDVSGTAEALYRALTMPEAERRRRMLALRALVKEGTAEAWARAFLTDLAVGREGGWAENGAPAHVSSAEQVAELVERVSQAPSLVLLLDYDGTLVPFTGVPRDAAPDHDLLELLERLAARQGTRVHVVSGRSRDQLAEWLGQLPIALHAEHGLWTKAAGDRRWVRELKIDAPPNDRIVRLMHTYSERTPGALVERKSAGLAWHYRMAEEELGRTQAAALAAELDAIAAEHGLTVLRGDKLVEVRPSGVDKGAIVAEAVADLDPGGMILAMGDDRTDEDLFAALPTGAVAVHVGPRESRADVRVADVADARELLRAVVGPKLGTGGDSH